MREHNKILIISIIVFVACASVYLAYMFIPTFNARGMTSMPHEYEEITTHSALIITGYYNNDKVNANNIKTTQLILFDEQEKVVEILVKEEYYDPQKLEEEFWRLMEYENLFFGTRIIGDNCISYTSIGYRNQHKEEILRRLGTLKDMTIEEIY